MAERLAVKETMTPRPALRIKPIEKKRYV